MTVLHIWAYRLCVLLLWGLLGGLFLPHVRPGEGAAGAACLLGALLMSVAIGIVRALWSAFSIACPWEEPPARR